jgi:magnesium-transporting ATPase (P-type)
LLLFRDEVRGLQPLGPSKKFELRIGEELISYMLVMGIIFLKALVNVEYFEMDQDERKYKNVEITVKRDGDLQVIKEENLMVGDILVVEANESIRVDGILLKSRNLIVSEAHTILHEDTKFKK